MADRDFFDQDLVKSRSDSKLGHDDALDDQVNLIHHPVSDINLTRMVERKEKMAEEAARTAQELESLRHRQELLQRQKKELEELRNKQAEYEQEKRAMLEHLSQSMISLEKKEIKANQMMELLGNARGQFKTMLDELKAINDDDWEEGAFREELGKALVTLDNIRITYNKSMAKIDTLYNAENKEEGQQLVMFNQPDSHARAGNTFLHWLQVGFAFSLPLMVTFAVIFIVFLVLYYRSGLY